LPARFRYPQPELQGDPQIYLPAGPDSAAPSRSSRNFRAIARLAPGMTLEQGKADLASLARELEQRYPADNFHAGVTVQPLIETIVGDSRRVLWFLFAGTACVLLIGCANFASLKLGGA
jgi:putative ABC transport system permease protein